LGGGEGSSQVGGGIDAEEFEEEAEEGIENQKQSWKGSGF